VFFATGPAALLRTVTVYLCGVLANKAIYSLYGFGGLRAQQVPIKNV